MGPDLLFGVCRKRITLVSIMLALHSSGLRKTDYKICLPSLEGVPAGEIVPKGSLACRVDRGCQNAQLHGGVVVQ